MKEKDKPEKPKKDVLKEVGEILKMPICYKTNKLCKYDCKGLCKDSC